MTKQHLSGQIAVLTGAGGGIGRATAEKLAQEKMKIVLLGGNHLEKLEETRSLVTQHTDCLMLPGDLTNQAFLDEGVARIIQEYGRVDVLINNAGMALNCSFEDVSEDQFDKIMKINVKAPYFLTQKLIPTLKKSNSATIINISSVVGHAGYPFQSAYAASKHALLGFTLSLIHILHAAGNPDKHDHLY